MHTKKECNNEPMQLLEEGRRKKFFDLRMIYRTVQKRESVNGTWKKINQ